MNQVFQSHSNDLDREVERISALLDLKAGMSYCEMGGANGLFFSHLAKKVMPGGHAYGTAPNTEELDAITRSAINVGISPSAITVTLASNDPAFLGLPKHGCDAIFSRLVYHMLPRQTALRYLSQLGEALRGGGKVFIVDIDPDNGAWTREKATALPFKMHVVPMAVAIEEFKSSNFKLERVICEWDYLGSVSTPFALYGLLWSFPDAGKYLENGLPHEFRSSIVGPISADDVLQFWYGSDAYPGNLSKLDATSSYIMKRIPVLMNGHLSTGRDVAQLFDAECALFTRLVLLVGTGHFNLTSAWNSEWGRHAQLLLLDQLPRNIFRGSRTQYAFANHSLRIARDFARDPVAHVNNFPGIVPVFTSIALMHSENISDFDLGTSLLNELATRYSKAPLIQLMRNRMEEHRRIIKNFGRFPHRNAMLGRESTSAEEGWMAFSPQPAWAVHSQAQF